MGDPTAARCGMLSHGESSLAARNSVAHPERLLPSTERTLMNAGGDCRTPYPARSPRATAPVSDDLRVGRPLVAVTLSAYYRAFTWS